MESRRRLAFVFTVAVLLCHSLALAGALDACEEYIRFGVPSENGELLCRRGYALAHNTERKTPEWVAERLTREKVNKQLPRSDNFRPDPHLEAGRRAELADYRKSGFDRGHMAPAANMRWDRTAMSESFYLSNIAPQVGPGMNRGIWASLERQVREWARERGEVYIFTGPIYSPEDDATRRIGPNRVAVPTHFYKVIFDPVRIEAIAFLMPNEKLTGRELAEFVVAIREIEALTGLDFLSAINADVQMMIETNRAERVWGYPVTD